MNTTNEMESLDCELPKGECDVARKVKVWLGSISVVILLLAFSCILLLRKYRLTHERMVCYLLLSTFGYTLAILSLSGRPGDSGTVSCRLQGFFIQFFCFAEMMWICSLTAFVYYFVIKNQNTSNHEKLYTVLGWILPAIVACIPLFTDDYDLSSATYCWISSSTAGHVFRILLYWAPAIIVNVGMFVTFTYVIFKTRKMSHLRELHTKQLKVYLIPIAGYAAAFLLISSALCITRLIQVSLKTTIGELIFISVAAGLWGIIISCLFFLTTDHKRFTRNHFDSGIKYYKTLLKRTIRSDALPNEELDEECILCPNQDSQTSILLENQVDEENHNDEDTD
ncbi:cadherin EGF LAG seven-pass G-type receptor 1-like isoform X2 [Watersipora subatra]|uniref:cadherin EGF LAG seven-pass G-type receptor 1-like isoform X2 n=1 Tax=Watersipora subatra TaxID=2589382 RepID=UPI00355C31B5